ncbi:hypothetical protein BG53_06615 [Paenibacillus darwinianus]|uniref:Arginine decarboxylase n=1 Tax=Paenibacillus darwinianus TaxID=1380763 RepID=A0A9W5W6Q2_9BACL|nr:aminotransferase class V-fold PLP-dependent enzyme [Paenibacillus darwinianus]EXX86140.1 hypothetical protein CH50_07845 [Paenibacillus darwinianus]EXX86354.1 hypothetical protein BG53_06615 [Paenibacillus darwinianus]EXX88532.1 hypothetical protein BG52_01935 [Paenibacillus darwinianus]
MTQFHAPLYKALVDRLEAGPTSFHVPGHKNGTQAADAPYERFRDLMSLDVTELSDTDDLHHPEGVIREAQQLAAACFGADDTMFLTGGSTAGILAMVLAVCRPGDTIIVQRNVHKSVLHGLMLAGAYAVFVTPLTDWATGLATIPASHDVEEAIRRYPHARAVMLGTPNYYGMCNDLSEYAGITHRAGIPLLVDQAHGAHLGLHPKFPLSALQYGADAVVHSTHKTLPALTMGAMLHVKGDRVSVKALRHALEMIQSSSPSYPIMASLDIARAMVTAEGAHLFEKGVLASIRFREQMRDLEDLYTLLQETDDSQAFDRLDPLRIVLYDRTDTLSGFQLLTLLSERGCWAEMADERYVVLIFGIRTSGQDADKLYRALKDIADQAGLTKRVSGAADRYRLGSGPSITNSFDKIERIGKPFLPGRTLTDENQTVSVPLRDSLNRIAAEPVIPYPPGIPLLHVGEEITQAAIESIRSLSAKGARFQNASNAVMDYVKVMKSDK